MDKQPKDIKVVFEYEPDMEKMVRALRVLLEWNPGKAGEQGQFQKQTKEEKTA